MEGMFEWCARFNQDLRSCNTSSLEHFRRRAFLLEATAFDSANLAPGLVGWEEDGDADDY